MRKNLNVIAAYSIMMALILMVGIFQSWNIALSIFNLCLISAVMTMGANIQWGYAGLIDNMINLIKKETRKSFKVVLTGGFSDLFTSSIKSKVKHNQDITIKGLIKISEQIK